MHESDLHFFDKYLKAFWWGRGGGGGGGGVGGAEELNEPDSFFCNFCESYRPASVDHEISKVGPCLILQLQHFVNHHRNFIKDIKKVQCTETLSVPVAVDIYLSIKSSTL